METSNSKRAACDAALRLATNRWAFADEASFCGVDGLRWLLRAGDMTPTACARIPPLAAAAATERLLVGIGKVAAAAGLEVVLLISCWLDARLGSCRMWSDLLELLDLAFSSSCWETLVVARRVTGGSQDRDPFTRPALQGAAVAAPASSSLSSSSSPSSPRTAGIAASQECSRGDRATLDKLGPEKAIETVFCAPNSNLREAVFPALRPTGDAAAASPSRSLSLQPTSKLGAVAMTVSWVAWPSGMSSGLAVARH
ncbi:hypothetical protein CAOG_010189 [Capsaspora owczarzaki ATCC 30864]|uniref:Uncharacterized protein n=1 Tax=Capsaspora owczarzaki (strain ATCC 30864) TaxID=595528 RepID=A0A0D2W1M4_CAPO3|nr:hypothetical protein CAOG_010189 [Capsaspora owczarzaki ATCC 30864]